MGHGVFGIWNEVFGNRMVYLVIEMVYMVCVWWVWWVMVGMIVLVFMVESSYKSQPPKPALVYVFHAGRIFYTDNTKGTAFG